MGLAKKDHVRELFKLDSVQRQWRAEFDRNPTGADINVIYEELEPALANLVSNYCVPVPGAIELFNQLKDHGIKIGTTTGYVAEMMNKIIPVTTAYGLIPDCIVNSSEVPSGRPAPWMIYRNSEILNVFPHSQMVKVGDTIADIQEGRNAGMWTIGLTKSGNELGLSLSESESADQQWVKEKIALAGEKFLNAGADFIAEGVWDCWPVFEEIDARIEQEKVNHRNTR
jgi:phosphonoacetaldehyde hydrolase